MATTLFQLHYIYGVTCASHHSQYSRQRFASSISLRTDSNFPNGETKIIDQLLYVDMVHYITSTACRPTPTAIVILGDGLMKASEEFSVSAIDWGVANKFLH